MRWEEVFGNISEEVLTEASRAPLYHGISLNHAITALQDNELKGFSPQRWWPDGKRRKDNDPEYQGSFWMKGISLTRDKNYAIQWAQQVLFVLDQDALRHNYKIMPLNWGFSIPSGNHHKKEREEYIATEMKPDRYMRKEIIDYDNEGEPIYGPNDDGLDILRFKAQGGAVKPLSKFLQGIYLYKNEPGTKQDQIVNHPKFLGFITK